MKSKVVQQYVGLDVHKESIQVAAMDKDGRVLRNAKISKVPRTGPPLICILFCSCIACIRLFSTVLDCIIFARRLY